MYLKSNENKVQKHGQDENMVFVSIMYEYLLSVSKILFEKLIVNDLNGCVLLLLATLFLFVSISTFWTVTLFDT